MSTHVIKSFIVVASLTLSGCVFVYKGDMNYQKGDHNKTVPNGNDSRVTSFVEDFGVGVDKALKNLTPAQKSNLFSALFSKIRSRFAPIPTQPDLELETTNDSTLTNLLNEVEAE